MRLQNVKRFCILQSHSIPQQVKPPLPTQAFVIAYQDWTALIQRENLFAEDSSIFVRDAVMR